MGWFHRTKRVDGQARHLRRHCYVFAAHLYQYATTGASRWASVLVGASLYGEGRCIPTLVAVLAQHLRLPAGVRHGWLGDRGLLSRPLWRGLATVGHFTVGRVRCHQVVYFAAAPAAGSCPARRGRPRLYGEVCRVDQLRRRYARRLRQHTLVLPMRGCERVVRGGGDCRVTPGHVAGSSAARPGPDRDRARAEAQAVVLVNDRSRLSTRRRGAGLRRALPK